MTIAMNMMCKIGSEWIAVDGCMNGIKIAVIGTSTRNDGVMVDIGEQKDNIQLS